MSQPIIIREDGIMKKVEWGFLLENTRYTRFEEHNQHIIESAFNDQANCYGDKHSVKIEDKILGAKATVHFSVENMHLRMTGTRYNVVRVTFDLDSPVYTTDTGESYIYPSSMTNSSMPLIPFACKSRHPQQTFASFRIPSSRRRPRTSSSSSANLIYARRLNLPQQRRRSRESSGTSTAANVSSVSKSRGGGVCGTRSSTVSTARSTSSTRYYNNTSINNTKLSAVTRTTEETISTPAMQGQQYIYVPSTYNAAATSFFPVSTAAIEAANTKALTAAVTIPQQSQDCLDGMPFSRLNQKPSKDWSQPSTSSSESPMSPEPSSPVFIHQEPNIATHQFIDYPNLSIDSMQQHQQQVNINAADISLPVSKEYYHQISKPATASIHTSNFTVTIPSRNNSCATATISAATPTTSVMDFNNYNAQSLTNIDLCNNFDQALSIFSIPVTPQNSMHELNQVHFPPQQQQRDLMVFDQLSNTMVPMTSEQLFESCAWSLSDTTNNMQQVFAAGTANNLQMFNTNNDDTFQFFTSKIDDDNTQMTSWSTNSNNETGSMMNFMNQQQQQ
ncbi:hypothetical protein BDA99DRAFT_535403 [Phascolomyces articulosus]|uniref:Uncharacterized protein n=1 Tax=Phascolomyces articulosus TaxID=60185 RepID=A0AAD5K561_9FUNG|nr:hypothetical protein BDA99DRAFT_535403 [Phascolomyces articulosus]